MPSPTLSINNSVQIRGFQKKYQGNWQLDKLTTRMIVRILNTIRDVYFLGWRPCRLTSPLRPCLELATCTTFAVNSKQAEICLKMFTKVCLCFLIRTDLSIASALQLWHWHGLCTLNKSHAMSIWCHGMLNRKLLLMLVAKVHSAP